MAGEWDVDALLRRIPAKLFREWEIDHELEPWGDLRLDYLMASVVQAIINVNRGKNDRPVKLEQCLLKFEGTRGEERAKQTPQQQFLLLKLLAAAHANDGPPQELAPQEVAPVEAALAAARAAHQQVH